MTTLTCLFSFPANNTILSFVGIAYSSICGLVQSTRIGHINEYYKWRCTDNGIPKSSPCGDEWPGLVCDVKENLGTIIGISLPQAGIRGYLSDNVFALTSLQYFDVSGNDLEGTIPTAIGDMQELRYLNLGSNKFSGAIPSVIGTISTLKYLFLMDANLTGTIPRTFGRLNNLNTLVLGFNKFSGTLPDTLGKLSSLLYLDVSFNVLTGSLADRMGDLSNIQAMDVSHNHLTGTVPASMFKLLHLIVFFPSPDMDGPYPNANQNTQSVRIVQDDVEHLVYVPP